MELLEEVEPESLFELQPEVKAELIVAELTANRQTTFCCWPLLLDCCRSYKCLNFLFAGVWCSFREVACNRKLRAPKRMGPKDISFRSIFTSNQNGNITSAIFGSPEGGEIKIAT